MAAIRGLFKARVSPAREVDPLLVENGLGGVLPDLGAREREAPEPAQIL
jgi:hypothetical protein